MKYLQYHEPDEHDNVKVIRVSTQEAINTSRTTAYRHGYSYKNDQEAIDDFIAVNWAYWVEE
jgi:hypothetical protein